GTHRAERWKVLGYGNADDAAFFNILERSACAAEKVGTHRAERWKVLGYGNADDAAFFNILERSACA
ncbi:hypothetical protein CQA48_30670, partial [Klebsiella pneumoniae]